MPPNEKESAENYLNQAGINTKSVDRNYNSSSRPGTSLISRTSRSMFNLNENNSLTTGNSEYRSEYQGKSSKAC